MKRKLEEQESKQPKKRAKTEHKLFEIDQVIENDKKTLEKTRAAVDRLFQEYKIAEDQLQNQEQTVADDFTGKTEAKSRSLAKWIQENKLNGSDPLKFLSSQLSHYVTPGVLLNWIRDVSQTAHEAKDGVWNTLFYFLRYLNRFDLQYYAGYGGFMPTLELTREGFPEHDQILLCILFQVGYQELDFTNARKRSMQNYSIYHNRIRSSESFLRYRSLFIEYLSSPSISSLYWDQDSIERLLDWTNDVLYDETTFQFETESTQDMSVVFEKWNDTYSVWYRILKKKSGWAGTKKEEDRHSFGRPVVTSKAALELAQKIRPKLNSRGILTVLNQEGKEGKEEKKEESKSVKGLDEDVEMAGSAEITPTPDVKSETKSKITMVALKFAPKGKYYVLPLPLVRKIPRIYNLFQHLVLNSADQKRQALLYNQQKPEIVFDSDEEQDFESNENGEFDFGQFGNVDYFLDFSSADTRLADPLAPIHQFKFDKIWTLFVTFLSCWILTGENKVNLLLERQYAGNLQMEATADLFKFLENQVTRVFGAISDQPSNNNWDPQVWNGLHILSQFLDILTLTEFCEMQFSIYFQRPMVQFLFT